VTDGIQQFRRPFSNATDWLSQYMRSENFILKCTRDHTFDANAANTNMDAAVRLCSCYPGENPVIWDMKSPHKPFSFRFGDISWKNVMVCFLTAYRPVSASEKIAFEI